MDPSSERHRHGTRVSPITDMPTADAALDCRAELLRLAIALLDDRAAAEDVVQEALLRYVGAAGPAPDSPRAWLARVTRNLAIDRLRRTRLERDTASRWPDLDVARGDGAPSPDEALARRERCREAIRALLEASSPRDAATVLLREVFGTGYAELARASGRGEAACRQSVHRTLGRVRVGARRSGAATGWGRDARGEPGTAAVAETEAMADVAERFEHAVLHARPAPLFDALRVRADGAASASASACHALRGVARVPHGARAYPRVDVDGSGARVSLVLDGVVLCTLPPVHTTRWRVSGVAAVGGVVRPSLRAGTRQR